MTGYEQAVITAASGFSASKLNERIADIAFANVGPWGEGLPGDEWLEQAQALAKTADDANKRHRDAGIALEADVNTWAEHHEGDADAT